jgi:DNA primase catalytic subunit
MEKYLNTVLPWEELCLFLHPIRHCAVAFTFGEHFRRNRQWETQKEARTYAEFHDCVYIPSRAKDGRRWETPIYFNGFIEFVEYIKRHKPTTIHVGAVYQDGPGGRKFENDNGLVSAPLRADLDIDEIDRAARVKCPCGLSKACCDVCWVEWMQPRIGAVLGFLCRHWKQVYAIFSGRRGMHFWVLDNVARDLTKLQRKLIYQHILQHLGVKLDEPVTTEPWHLCKIPFFPHGETGLIAVPVDVKKWRDFRPSTVPTLHTATAEKMREYAAIFDQC